MGAVSPIAPGRPRVVDPLINGSEFHGMVGTSSAMQQLYQEVRRVGQSAAPVLVIGETGTGKKLVARAIHACSPRRTAPFVAVNCAALPRELIESELFGYRRGAFSGAINDYVGLFRSAAGGTVLLDEITEMNPELQAKLLRVIQEGHVRPVGSVDEIAIDVRFVASTNREPEQLLASGTLRPDLYYRLAASVVEVPPLRRREGDIPLLARHHLERVNQRYEAPELRVNDLSCDGLAALEAHPWPGNVRELFNAVERGFNRCSGRLLTAADVGMAARRDCGLALELDPETTYAENERALIERSLVASGGNKAQAARRLGISRKKLYARLAKYSSTDR